MTSLVLNNRVLYWRPLNKFQGHRSISTEEKDFWRFLQYMAMAAILVMRQSPVVYFLFHYSQKLSHDIWFQITWQIFRKMESKFKHKVTFGKGHIMTLTFDIHVASFNHLVWCILQLWDYRLQYFSKNK